MPSLSGRAEIRVIQLNDGEHLETVVRRFRKGQSIRFVYGSSLLGHSIRLITNYPGHEQLKWTRETGTVNDDLSLFAQLKPSLAGSFSYRFFINDQKESSGSGFFLIDPELNVNGEYLPLDAIQCITHLAKLLGPLSEWERRLRVAYEAGYNMIHLTPVQRLGISNSSYSIADHLTLNDAFSTKKTGMDDLREMVHSWENKWKMLTIQDVVWNHAAKNSPWLQEHPESAYNCVNSPHLRPAYVLDRLYHHFGLEIAEGKWSQRGLPSEITEHSHLQALRDILTNEILPQLRLADFYQVPIEQLVLEFRDKARNGITTSNIDESLEIIQDPEYRRFGCSVDMNQALKIFNRFRDDAWSDDDRIEKCTQTFRSHLEYLNNKAGCMAWEICMTGVNAVMGHVSYERLDYNGPRKALVSRENPLVTSYFLHLEDDKPWKEEEALAYDAHAGQFLMAFNGWVMNHDPLKNFAESDSQVYLRRELICWGDCVKLCYGRCPEDSPFLWTFMTKYSEMVATIFHGLRIDNCHSTPIHVAEYFLQAARKVRPDLYVVAELFTGSEEAQSAGDCHEQGRLVYRYGGVPVASFFTLSNQQMSKPSVAHALFYDLTHDNPCPIIKRSIRDLAPTAAMISMACCAIGTTRGYDELVPFAIDVVKEERLYCSWDETCDASTGIIAVRRVLNKLHMELGEGNFNQVFVDQMTPSIVAITRHNPITHESVVLVARTAFEKNYGDDYPNSRDAGFEGVCEEILFEFSLVEKHSSDGNGERQSFMSMLAEMSNGLLSGLKDVELYLKEHIRPEDSRLVSLHDQHFKLNKFPAGSAFAFRVKLGDSTINAIGKLRAIFKGENLQDLDTALKKTNLQSLNRVLFRCNEEEEDEFNSGVFRVPNGPCFVYCGLQGLISPLSIIRENNDLGHPICGNLRAGLWMAEYTVARLKKHSSTLKIGEAIEGVLSPLMAIPTFLRPAYFEALISLIFEHCLKAVFDKMDGFVSGGSRFVQSVALSSVCFLGECISAGLSPLPDDGGLEKKMNSLAAGLPHFACGIWRNWGRDTFIALPGCLLVTGRFEDARCLILSYGGALRHGLIPNLLAEGKTARYNCRDATWFWLFAITKYIQMAPKGEMILRDKLLRIYPTDETIFGQDQREEELHETMNETLERHFNGIHFRERNSGWQIDEHMRFNMDAYVDLETGFIMGGNGSNCGTWMDKMGSSDRAGNRGEPATPRDGAAVELQGLAHHVLIALSKCSSFPRQSVKHNEKNMEWSLEEWANRIEQHFQDCFYVDEHDEHPLIHRRGIVKDSYGSSAKFTDFQLRPNCAIALTLAPTLLDADKAWNAIKTVDEILSGPLGVKTLDPKDWNYHGFYNNNDDSITKKTAKGFNYHQGPEWLWVSCYVMRAQLAIAARLRKGKGNVELWQLTLSHLKHRLGNFWQHIEQSIWRSLPELTQENGIECPGSCPAQAWSVGCLLELLHDLHRYGQEEEEEISTRVE